MRHLIIVTTIAALSLGGVAFAQSGDDSHRDQPVMNHDAPAARPSHRAVVHAPARNVHSVKSDQHRVATRKPAVSDARYSSARHSQPDDFSADGLNHQELLRHTDNHDDSPR
ncbi:MAG TPA: hypothetical protein VGP48_08880 [Stellaceae bacterium]|jgi:hypothetical protein|nr:hypothetical protein [Stellaceae bacterium]